VVANVRRGGFVTAEAKSVVVDEAFGRWVVWIRSTVFFFFFPFLIFFFLLGIFFFFKILQKKFWHCKDVKCKLIMIIIMIS
jgi:hypothetical protein